MNYIKLLRGAPLTVFLAILSLGGVAERREIRKRTGYSYPTIDKACADLAEAGLAVQDNSWEWHILEASPQMILGASKNFLPTTTYINRDSDIESSKTLTEEASKNFGLSPNILSSPDEVKLIVRKSGNSLFMGVGIIKGNIKSSTHITTSVLPQKLLTPMTN